MKAWLMDAYRKGNKIALWLKTPQSDFKIEKDFQVSLFADPHIRPFLEQNKIKYTPTTKLTYLRKPKEVLEIPVPSLDKFERFIKFLERGTRYRVPIYNADVKPEQLFLYKNDLIPCSPVEIIDDEILAVEDDISPALIQLNVQKDEDLLKLNSIDPDVIMMNRAFARLPRISKAYPELMIHRWDPAPLIYRGGKSYYSYGIVRYQDFAIRLHGRYLVDTSTMIGHECSADGIMELCRLSGTLFQVVASRSFGAVFQSALVRQMIRNDFLVPYKEKPIEKPLNMLDFLKADRAGQYLDPVPGFHCDVAEIDFASMFPWLIYNRNISADSIMCEEGPYEYVPGLPIRISLRYKGLGPLAIKPMLDKRMEYKKNPSLVSKQRSIGLKWVLVSSYGYLRFREFKLGMPTAHQAISSYARETLVGAMRLAEEHGFEVVHGIVDSLYLKKQGICEDEVKDFCKELESLTGIPVSFEGIFRWIVFLPSVNEPQRQLPAKYYGVFKNGSIKARGIEARQDSMPLVVKYFQQRVIEMISDCISEHQIMAKLSDLLRFLGLTVKNLRKADKRWLQCKMRISKTNYKNDVAQKKVIKSMQRNGASVHPGQVIEFIHSLHGAVLPEDYAGDPDVWHYAQLLARSLFVLLQPFGIRKEEIMATVTKTDQTSLMNFMRTTKN